MGNSVGCSETLLLFFCLFLMDKLQFSDDSRIWGF